MKAHRRARSVLTIGLVLLSLLAVTAVASAGSDALPASAGRVSDTPNLSSDSYSYYFHYKFVAGTTLRPRDSSSNWDYGGVGCVSLANGSQLLNVHLGLPEGSRIDYLRIYYYDTSGNNGRAWITTYNGAGSYSDITSVTSAGNGGYGTRLSPYVGHVVDNYDNSYVLNWSANQTGSSMALCGMRVAYRLRTLDTFLPTILKS